MNKKADTNTYSTQDTFLIIRNTTLFMGLGNAAIATTQLFVAYWSASHALFADAMHTYADLVIDVLTYFAGFYGHQPPDAEHPYGHRRIETVTAVFLALFLASLGLGIIIDTVFLDQGSVNVITEYVLIASGISVVCNEILFRYATFQAKRIRSDLLAASATHQRSDALSSVLVFATACASYLPINGWNVDKLAAVIIGLMIMKMSLKICYRGIRELIDTGITERERDKMIATMLQTPGVEDIHFLRTRKMAGSVFVDVHVITKSRISVSEGHFIGESLRHELKREHPHVVDVTVHIDPEDDEIAHNKPQVSWPARNIILYMLKRATSRFTNIHWQEEDVVLHYLIQGIEIEIVLTQALDQDKQTEYSQIILEDLRHTEPQIHKLTFVRKTVAMKK